jgi:hypothetical protein
LSALASGAAHVAERALPAVMVAFVLAAVVTRVLAIGDVWDGYSAHDAMALQSVRWWTYSLGWAGEVVGNPWVYFGVVLVVASLAVPEAQVPNPPRWRVLGLRAVTICALACVAAEPHRDIPYRAIPVCLGGLALLIATRRGALPSWQVALGAWVLTSRMGWTTRVFARWHEAQLAPCMPPPETLAELAPACVAFHLSAALALLSDKAAPHAGLRRLAAVWALFAALDTGIEVAVGHGLTQREPWTAWVFTWSVLAQALACCAVVAIAAAAYESLRAALFREELDPRFGGRASIAAVFGLCMLAPVLARHPLPWDVNDAAFDALGDVPDVTSLRAAPWLDLPMRGARPILIADSWGSLHDAQTGSHLHEFTGLAYGVIMDQDATISDFTRVATRVIGGGARELHWALPRAIDDPTVAAIPSRYAIRGFAERQLVYTNVSAFLASPNGWHSNDPPAEGSLHLVAEALGDETRLGALLEAPPESSYRVLFNPDDLYNYYRARQPPRVARNPLSQVFRDSAHTMTARLLPLLAGLVLAYLAFLASIARDLAQLRRERSAGQWLRSAEPFAANPSVPRLPPWIPADEAQFVRLDGSPYRATGMARAATEAAAREHVRLCREGLLHVGAAYVGALLVFLVAVMVAAVP